VRAGVAEAEFQISGDTLAVERLVKSAWMGVGPQHVITLDRICRY
jgi:hypothetical protein